MYKAGDKVFYPTYGVVTIENVKERKVLGEKRLCYVMKVDSPEMKLILPAREVEKRGLRDIISPDRVKNVVGVLQRETEAEDWSKPSSYYSNKLASSNILDIAEVVRKLLGKKAENSLGKHEKTYLERGLSILSSEIACAKGMAQTKAKQLILDSWSARFEKSKTSEKKKSRYFKKRKKK